MDIQRAVSQSTAELRSHWEVPAIAHFCSLFRSIFGLQDFDMEDLEEALSIDATSRHSLVVDLLLTLIKGCTGRRDVSMLNYNEQLWDLLQKEWLREQESSAEAKNPLGKVRARANFHALPLYPKLKLLHWLCELRLTRPDVEALTKNLDGDSLRVSELGRDDSGAAYWYFFGTRLYKEEPGPIPKITLPNPSPASAKSRQSKKKTPRGGRRSLPRKRKRSQSSDEDQLTSEEENEDEEEEEEEYPPPPPPKKTPKGGRKAAKTPSSSKSGKAKTPSSESTPSATKGKGNTNTAIPARRSLRQAVKRGFPVLDMEDESSRDSLPQTPQGRTKPSVTFRAEPHLRQTPASSAPVSEDEDPVAAPKVRLGSRTMDSIIKRIYSRDEDEEGDEEKERSQSPEFKTPAPPQQQEQNSSEQDEKEMSKEVAEAKEEPLKDESMDVTPPQEGHAPEASSSGDTLILDQPGKGKEEVKEEEKEEGEVAALEEEEEDDPDPTPWDQPALHPDPERTKRWHLRCTTLADWTELTESLKSRSKVEKKFLAALREDFLPHMEELFAAKEKERARKEAELNRRVSERVGLRKAAEEAEKEKLAKREEEERARLEAAEEAKRRKQVQEDREARRKQREKERDRAARNREKSKEDRAKRLSLRQQRQELIRLGQPVPEEMLPTSFADDEDDEEEELEETYVAMERVLDSLKKHPDAEPFLEPVTEEVAPDYTERIEQPMCLEWVEDKLIERAYKNKLEFVEDVNRIFTNCLAYNGRESEYTRLAQSLERGFLRAFHKYFPRNEAFYDSARLQREMQSCVDRLGALDKELNKELYAQREAAARARAAARQTHPHPIPPRPAFATSANATASPAYLRTVAKTPPSSSRTQPFGPRPTRVYGSNAAYKVLSPAHATPITPGRQPNRVSSSFTPRAPTTIRAPMAGAGTRPSVYLLPAPDGENRLLKFITKDGQPAPNELVQRLLPQLKKEAHKLPKGFLTLTIDSQDAPEEATSSQAQAAPPAPAPIPSLPESQAQPQPQATAPPPSTSEAASAVALLEASETASTSTATPQPPPPPPASTSSASASLTASGTAAPPSTPEGRLYHIGENSYLAIEKGNPFLYKKTAEGGLVKVQQVSREGLLEKLKRIQAQKAQLPVCSVAPQLAPQQHQPQQPPQLQPQPQSQTQTQAPPQSSEAEPLQPLMAMTTDGAGHGPSSETGSLCPPPCSNDEKQSSMRVVAEAQEQAEPAQNSVQSSLLSHDEIDINEFLIPNPQQESFS